MEVPEALPVQPKIEVKVPVKTMECFYGSKNMSIEWRIILAPDLIYSIMTTQPPFTSMALLIPITSHTHLSECATASSFARPFPFMISRPWTRP